MMKSLEEQTYLEINKKGVISLDEIPNYSEYNNLLKAFSKIPLLRSLI